MSTHSVQVVQVGPIEKHPDPEATNLVLTHVRGWPVVIRRGEFQEGDKAIYVEPDYLVPLAHPLFEFLRTPARSAGFYRIGTRRLRGVLSYGLLLRLPPELADSQVGDDLMERLGIFHYVSSYCGPSTGMDQASPPAIPIPVFDVEPLHNWPDVFVPGEPVYVTEKIHGSSARYVYLPTPTDARSFHLGSRRVWLHPESSAPQARLLQLMPSIERWCRHNPGKVLYGEVYGPGVQSWGYGLPTRHLAFRAFAIWDTAFHRYLDTPDFLAMLSHECPEDAIIPVVPPLHSGSIPFDMGRVVELASGESLLGAPYREGAVVTPLHERTHPKMGRVAGKVINPKFYGAYRGSRDAHR